MKETVLRIRRKQNSAYYGGQRTGVEVVAAAFVVGYGEGLTVVRFLTLIVSL